MNWDLTSYFPAFDGPEMRVFKEKLGADIAALTGQAAHLEGLGADNVSQWEEVLVSGEDIASRLSHLSSYIGCLSSADAANEAYSREEAALSRLGAEASKLGVEVLRAFKAASDEVFVALIERPALEGCRYYLERRREEAQRSMAPQQERLAADLGVDGIQAWGRLYSTVAGKLEFDMVYPDGRSERLPMAQRRSLFGHPDRQVRRAAFEGGSAAWAQMEDVAAAALNAISGTRLTLNRQRGVEHFLDIALFGANISHSTLEAMFAAIEQTIELPRSIMRLKADTMGAKGVAWYDLEAPLPLTEQAGVEWEGAKDMVERAFSQAYPSLGSFVRQTYDKEWIEWEPRPGKRPGAFCTSSRLSEESRIFMTFNQSMGDVRTLAHEAGHAFHNFVMKGMRTYRRRYPMTLAESASTFGEMLLTEGILSDPEVSPVQKAQILDMEASHGAVYLLDIPVRFHFEKALYQERADGELSVSRMKELMVETQRRVFGDVLEAGGEDPYFWAWKLHFYITGTTFYNFPYTFGFLLSRGLFARFKEEGRQFLPRYEEFLRLTGSDSAEAVAQRTIGVDLTQADFWRQAIGTLEEPLTQLRQVLPQVLDQ